MGATARSTGQSGAAGAPPAGHAIAALVASRDTDGLSRNTSTLRRLERYADTMRAHRDAQQRYVVERKTELPPLQRFQNARTGIFQRYY